MSDTLVQCDLSEQREAGVFRSLRGTIVRTIVGEAIHSARLRVSVLAILTGLFWIGLFLLFADGFRFLRSTLSQETMRVQVVEAVFNSFFLTLTAMIAVSSAIVLYGGLYRSDEVRMLLTLPVRAERIVLHKFQEAALVSCWGFLLLGTPLLIAYGIVNESPASFYVLIVPFMVAFTLIPAAIGAIACLFFSHALPGLRYGVVAAILLAAAIAFAVLYWQVVVSPPRDLLTPGWLHGALARFRFSEQRLLPSWWLSSGLLSAAHPPEGATFLQGDPVRFLALLGSSALLLQLALSSYAARVFRPSFSRLYGIEPAKRTASALPIDRVFALFTLPFSPLMRSLMLKDFRLFRRDPILWGQFLVFFGLLGLYMMSLRKFEYVSSLRSWVTVISFMNVGVVALIFSTFATRFILPLISLEGRSFWVLGTAPIERDAVVSGKFLLASTSSIPPCALLVLGSDWMLQIPQRMPLLAAVHVALIVLLCLCLSALAVGNGARFPNLRENSPSRIAAGFGGTLNLVESCILIIAVTLLIAAPSYAWVERESLAPPSASFPWNLWGTQTAVLLGFVFAALPAAFAARLALNMGKRAFRSLGS